jgi:hypothetical protein
VLQLDATLFKKIEASRYDEDSWSWWSADFFVIDHSQSLMVWNRRNCQVSMDQSLRPGTDAMNQHKIAAAMHDRHQRAGCDLNEAMIQLAVIRESDNERALQKNIGICR